MTEHLRPQDKFDICYSHFRRCRAMMHKIGIINPMASCKKAWRPYAGVKVMDYCADFSRVGQNALRRPRWASRLTLFQLYHLEEVGYRVILSHLRIRPGTFDWWVQDVKREVGKELEGGKLWPPRNYFTGEPEDDAGW